MSRVLGRSAQSDPGAKPSKEDNKKIAKGYLLGIESLQCSLANEKTIPSIFPVYHTIIFLKMQV